MTTGDPIPEGSKSEVIDLSDPDNICDPLPDYPLGEVVEKGGSALIIFIYLEN